MVSEPDDQDADCEDVGVAFVSIPDILKKKQDLKEQDVDSRFFFSVKHRLWFLSLFVVPASSPSHGRDLQFVSDINQPSLPTPFYSVLAYVSM